MHRKVISILMSSILETTLTSSILVHSMLDLTSSRLNFYLTQDQDGLGSQLSIINRANLQHFKEQKRRYQLVMMVDRLMGGLQVIVSH